MRLSPTACFKYDDVDSAMQLADQQSLTTHASITANECCRFLAGSIPKLLQGKSYQDAKVNISSAGWSIDLKEMVAYPQAGCSSDNIPPDGFVQNKLKAEIWAIENTKDFKDAVLLALSLEDDVDTTAAATRQIADARYSYTSINYSLKQMLGKERKLYVKSQFFILGLEDFWRDQQSNRDQKNMAPSIIYN